MNLPYFKKSINIPSHYFVTASAWISRISIAVIQIFTIRTLLLYLGQDKYAAYIIIYSLLPWCNLADFGIGTALQNYISESRVKGRDYNIYIKTCFQIISLIFFILIPILILFSNYLQTFLLKHYLYINEIKNINIILIICFIYIILSFVNISIKILYAMQKGVIPNILQMVSYIISAVFIVILKKFFTATSSITIALLCFSLPQILIMAIPFIKIFKNSIKHIAKVDLPVFKEFIIRAVKFGGFAFMALAVLQIDYFVMARTIDPVSITSYNIFNKVFIFAFFIYSSLLSAFWPVSSELFNNHNYVKLKNLLKNYTYIGILFMFLCIIFVYIFKNFIIKILAPDMFFTLNISFFILFSLYYILRVISDTYAMFLQSINVLKIFWIYTPVQACISITAQYFLSIKYGINGIILGLILSFIFTSAWILPYKSYKIFKSKSNN